MLMFTICMGFALGTTMTVGKYMTRSDTKNTKRICFIAVGFSVLNIAVLCILLLAFNENIIFLFIDNQSVVDIAYPIIILIAEMYIFDIIQKTIGSVFKAFRKQKIASIMGFFQFYVLQTTLSYVFAFVFDLRVFGLWLSLTTGYFLAIFTYLIIIYF